MVTQENSVCLLSAFAAQDLGIKHIICQAIECTDLQIKQIIREHSAIFEGIGKLRGYSVEHS